MILFGPPDFRRCRGSRECCAAGCRRTSGCTPPHAVPWRGGQVCRSMSWHRHPVGNAVGKMAGQGPGQDRTPGRTCRLTWGRRRLLVDLSLPTVRVDLWRADAIVPFEWLRTADMNSVPTTHPAEKQALMDLLTRVERETDIPVSRRRRSTTRGRGGRLSRRPRRPGRRCLPCLADAAGRPRALPQARWGRSRVGTLMHEAGHPPTRSDPHDRCGSWCRRSGTCWMSVRGSWGAARRSCKIACTVAV